MFKKYCPVSAIGTLCQLAFNRHLGSLTFWVLPNATINRMVGNFYIVLENECFQRIKCLVPRTWQMFSRSIWIRPEGVDFDISIFFYVSLFWCVSPQWWKCLSVLYPFPVSVYWSELPNSKHQRWCKRQMEF